MVDLGIEDIDHSKTKVRSPQTNGICERFHRTIKDECGSGLKSPDKIFRNLFPIVKRHFETPLDIHS